MRRLCFAGVFALTMIGTGFWLLPNHRSNFALADMAEAMAKVSTVHFTGYALDDNGNRHDLEGWVKGATKIRIKVEGKQDIADDGSRLTAVEWGDLRKVTIRNSGNLPGLAKGMTYLDLFDRPGALGSAIEANGAEVINDEKVTVNGKTYRATELQGDSGTKMRILTDTGTNLLVRSETYDRSGKLVESIERVEYNIPVSDSVFKMSVPKDLPVIHMWSEHRSDRFLGRKEEFRRPEYDMNAACLLQAGRAGPQYHTYCMHDFHPGVRFEVWGQDFVAVHYLSDRNVYRIVGKGRAIDPKDGWRSDIVEDGDIRVPGEPQIEEVLMMNGKPGDYCGKGVAGLYRFKNVGPGPATISHHRILGCFLVRGRVQALPTDKVYTNEAVVLGDIEQYIESGGKLHWEGLPQDEVAAMKADLDVAVRLAQIGRNDHRINGQEIIASYGGGSTVHGMCIEPAGPGTELKILETSDRIYVVGRARITPGGKIVKNAVLSKEGEVISSEE